MKWVSPDEKLSLLSQNLCPTIRYEQAVVAGKNAFLLSGFAKVFHLQGWASRRLSYSLCDPWETFQLPVSASMCSPCCGINAELLFKFPFAPLSLPLPPFPALPIESMYYQGRAVSLTANVIHQTQSALSALFLSKIHYLYDTAEFFACYLFNPLLLIRKNLKPDCSVWDDPKIKTQILISSLC